jgi:Ohr subfamily peroxiredoxin
MSALYTAEVTAVAGRRGKVQSVDGEFGEQLRAPVELGGPGRPGTNPEELFAAAYSSCLHSSLLAVARERRGVTVEGSSVTARVSLCRDSQGYALVVELTLDLPGLERSEAEALAQEAHHKCPYSKALAGNVDVSLTVAV